MALPDQGELSYNGVTFSSLYTSNVSGRPVLDEAGRTVKWLEFTISVRAYVRAEGDADDGVIETTMADTRRRLVKPAGRLRYENKGFGSGLIVNDDEQTRDSSWGPWPTLYGFKPVGSNRMALVDWSCVVRVPDCDDARYKNRPLQFSYSVDYGLDVDRYTTRTVTGVIEIPMTRRNVNVRGIPDHVDFYRELAEVPPIPGFRREGSTCRITADKRRMDWTARDVELPHALPPGATQCDITHTTSGQLEGPMGGFAVWRGHISGSVVAPARETKLTAWDKFMIVVHQRLGLLRQQVSRVGNNAPNARGEAGTILLTGVTFTDSVYGRPANFHIEYRVCGTSLEEIFYGSGLWTKVAGVTNERWQKSMEVPWGVRGPAGCEENRDVIIDACTNEQPVIPGVASNQPAETDKPTLKNGASPPPQIILGNPPSNDQSVSPETSWLAYQPWIQLLADMRVVRHRPLVERGNTEPYGEDAMKDLSATKDGHVMAFPDGQEDAIQFVGTPKIQIRLHGKATRMTYRIPVPRLVSVGGVATVESHRDWQETVVGMAGGYPVYHAVWNILFEIPKPPQGKLPIPAHPAYGTGGLDGESKVTGTKKVVLKRAKST